MTRARTLLFVAVLVLSAGCDHAAKQIARDVLAGSPGVAFAADMLRFELAENPGGFMSLGAGLDTGLRGLFFLGFVPLLLTLLCVFVLRSGAASRASLLGLGGVAGGGLANWLDRLLHDGSVTDFVSLGIGPLRTGVFNLADVAVVGGCLLLFLARPQRPEPSSSGN
jgi:signal peptidase II